MAKPKITVAFDGKVIGNRKTDRTYTHAVVLSEFNARTARTLETARWNAWGAKQARSNHAHYSIDSAVVAATPVEQYVEQQRLDAVARSEESIARCTTQGPVVLSYHGSHELACRAAQAAAKDHAKYTAVIVQVQA